MGKLSMFSFSSLVVVLVATHFLVGCSASKFNNLVSGKKSSSKGGLLGYIQKLNPFSESAGSSKLSASNSAHSSAGSGFSRSSSSSSFSSANGHLSGVSSQHSNVNGHVQGSTTFHDNGKSSTIHSGHYAGSITCPNCQCHFALSTGPSCMARTFGGKYSQNLNSDSSASSHGSNVVQKIGNTINNLMSSSHAQTALSQSNSHSNIISSSNPQNSNSPQSSGSQFTSLMAKADASASSGSFAASSAHGAQSQSASHSNSFSGLNMENTNYAQNVGSQFTNLMANTHADASTQSFASSATQSQTALNQGHVSTGSQFANAMSTSATQVHGDDVNHALHNANSMASASSSSSHISASSLSNAGFVGSQDHNSHHHKCPSCGSSNYNSARSEGTSLAHSESLAFTGSEHGSNSFSAETSAGMARAGSFSESGSLTSNKGSFGDKYIRSLASATASAHSSGHATPTATAIAHAG